MMKLIVNGLSFFSTEADLLELFDRFGPVLSVEIAKDSLTRRSRGYGYVQLKNDAKAHDAIHSLQGRELDGCSIAVREVRESVAPKGFHFRFS